MSLRLPHLTRREWLALAAASPLFAKANSLHIACQCYVFEQDYAERKQEPVDEVERWLRPNLG